MPISSITSNQVSLPSLVKESRLRTTVLEAEDVDARGDQNAVIGDAVAEQEATQRVIPAAEVEPENFQRAPSFDDLPTPQRLALETYLQTEQAALVSAAPSGGDVIVGVDTFV